MPWLLWLFLYIHYSTAAQKLKSICLRTHVHNTTCHIRVSFWRMQLFECDIILVYESMTNVVKRTTLTHLFNEWPIFNASDGICTSCWPSFVSKWHSILTASITTSNLLSLIKSKSLAFGLSSFFLVVLINEKVLVFWKVSWMFFVPCFSMSTIPTFFYQWVVPCN